MVPIEKIVADSGKPRFESSVFWSVVFNFHYIKWFLVAFIILPISTFELQFSSLNLFQADTVFLKNAISILSGLAETIHKK